MFIKITCHWEKDAWPWCILPSWMISCKSEAVISWIPKSQVSYGQRMDIFIISSVINSTLIITFLHQINRFAAPSSPCDKPECFYNCLITWVCVMVLELYWGALQGTYRYALWEESGTPATHTWNMDTQAYGTAKILYSILRVIPVITLLLDCLVLSVGRRSRDFVQHTNSRHATYANWIAS